jgi:hypothetical protein
MTVGSTSPSAGSTAAIPTSRAYWELKAEQMMNRLFAPEPAIDLEPEPPSGLVAPTPGAISPPASTVPPRLAGIPMPPPPPAAFNGATPGETRPGPGRGPSRPDQGPAMAASPHGQQPPGLWHLSWRWLDRLDRPVLLLGALGAVGLGSALAAIVVLGQWNQMQVSLRQERNLLLLERLRQLGPANPQPASSPSAASGAAQAQTSPDGLAPPPEEPWMQQLGQLPTGPEQGSGAPVLRVPLSPRLTAPAPAASGAASTTAAAGPAGPLPQLVGVVATPGRPGSAIFQLNGSSTSVGVGEMVGSSGWRLRAADGDSAVLERGSELRRLAIGPDS